MLHEFEPHEMNAADQEVLAAVQPGDRIFLRDGRLARMDKPTFTKRMVVALKSAFRTALHSLNASPEQMADFEFEPVTPLSASISVTVALEDGRKAMASADLWPSRHLH